MKEIVNGTKLKAALRVKDYFKMLPKTHEEFRRSVCVGCHRSGVDRQVTNASIHQVRQKIYSGFSDIESLPIGLCCRCRHMLKSDQPFYKNFEYDDLVKTFKRTIVKGDGPCPCYICLLGRAKNKTKMKKKKPGPKTQETPPSVKVCTKCSQEINKGKPHPCIERSKANNLLKLAAKQVVKEQIANEVIKEKRKIEGDQEISLRRTRGRPLPVVLALEEGKKKVPVRVTHKQLDNIQKKRNLSDRGMRDICQALRKISGKKSVQPHYRDHISEKTN